MARSRSMMLALSNISVIFVVAQPQCQLSICLASTVNRSTINYQSIDYQLSIDRERGRSHYNYQLSTLNYQST
ncbi:MAG: hypothetical protein ACRC62_05325 [Microcoleus sp.]